MDDDLTIFPSRPRAALRLAGALGCVAPGVPTRHDEPLIGWSAAGLSGLCLPVALALLVPRWNAPTLGAAGFTVRSRGRAHHPARADGAGFQVLERGTTRMVGMRYRPGYARHHGGRSVVAAFTGVEGALPGQYTVHADQLQAIMSDALARHGGGAHA